jgi:EAL domain-containing protein (putative c-di-GMP-specific phosphodiesterase class I)
VAPDRFVPVAEGNPELSDMLTFWALERAAQYQQALTVLGLDLQIAVNVSAVNLRDLRFPDLALEVVRRAGAKAPRIAFELTETATFQDPRRTAGVLRRLRAMGFELALDDFGTGYSTLKVLKQMPFSALKIDRCFIADLLASRDSAAIVLATIEIARHMELQTVAEGIETEEIAAALRAMGIDALQGYHIGHPMPAEKLIAQLT